MSNKQIEAKSSPRSSVIASLKPISSDFIISHCRMNNAMKEQGISVDELIQLLSSEPFIDSVQAVEVVEGTAQGEILLLISPALEAQEINRNQYSSSGSTELTNLVWELETRLQSQYPECCFPIMLPYSEDISSINRYWLERNRRKQGNLEAFIKRFLTTNVGLPYDKPKQAKQKSFMLETVPDFPDELSVALSELKPELKAKAQERTLLPLSLEPFSDVVHVLTTFSVWLIRYTLRRQALLKVTISNSSNSQPFFLCVNAEDSSSYLALLAQVQKQLKEALFEHELTPNSLLNSGHKACSLNISVINQIGNFDFSSDFETFNDISTHFHNVELELNLSATIRAKNESTNTEKDNAKNESKQKAESKTEYSWHWGYDANLFNLKTIHQFCNSFSELLLQTIRNPGNDIFCYSLLSEEHRQSLLTNNMFEKPEYFSAENELLAQIDKIAQRYANNDAVIWRDNNGDVIRLSYRDLNEQANRLANYLLSMGVGLDADKGSGKSDRVGVCLQYSPNVLIAMLAIFKCGAQYVPLDPEYPSQRLDFMVGDSALKYVINEQSTRNVFKSHDVSFITLDSPSIISNLDGMPSQLPAIANASGLPAYVMYTSGSTGVPKGVVGTHDSIINRLMWFQEQFPADKHTVFAGKTSISFIDHIAEVLQPLVSGSTLVMLDSKENRASPLLEAIRSYSIQRITLIPSQLQAMLAHENNHFLRALKMVFSSGEPLFQHLVDEFHWYFQGKVELVNVYGSTETGADVTLYHAQYPEYMGVLKYFQQEQDSIPGARTFKNAYSQLGKTELSHYQGEKITQPNVPLEELKEKFSQVELPAHPKDFEAYFQQLQQDLFPYMINVSSKKYIGHMTSALPNFIPEFSRFISQANQNVVKVETSKSLTLMERQVMAMLHKLFFNDENAYYRERVQDPHNMFGIVTSGGSLANITALYCARNKGLIAQGINKAQLQQIGANEALLSLGYKKAVILVSRLAHYSIKKTVGLLGLGENNLILIEQDEQQRIKTAELQAQIQQCRENKQFIIAIIGIAGATETGTIDPLPEMAQIAQQHDIHFHVDAAWGGAFVFSDDYRFKLNGIEHADTITFCAHKQLYLAQGISLCLFKDPQSVFAVTTHADYQAASGSFDLGQFTLEGSRPAASLMLHASLHLFSHQGYSWMLSQSMEKTAYFRELIEQSDAFELVGENDLNIINYRYIPKALRNTATSIEDNQNKKPYSASENAQISAATDDIQTQQFLRGETFVSKTRILHKRYGEEKITVFRVVPINPLTRYEDLLAVLNDQLQIASEIIENDPIPQRLVLGNSLQASHSVPDRAVVPIGTPIANIQLYILDQNLKLLPDGVIGEVYVSGCCLAREYQNLPAMTDRCFIANPFSQSAGFERMYRTGDLARRRNGNIEFCGRSDHQVKINGHRLELDEIEAHLMKLSIVQIAKVVKLDSATESEGFVVAYIQPSDSADTILVEEHVRRELAARLPSFMIPEQIYIFKTIPTLPNGKIDLHSCSKAISENKSET
ncbi:aminotransferase class V-fold PLP-dependent enzyme [Paraneptunicella aestuarii]|uniref:aminotransferase class V-fold PLP-dependent enzyme n=1 Tax=Paraneptunicella aestuarii TaxID=2831148 RepID=UPI001E5533CD|nr:aminotransferase class V-fold PLP-dependent enzyme [Paraneptunicella aestuarii]UAA40632.1 aminotransferase class V-fold PLP-dependent enzyme [Paraneptunicella aestuarii]